MRREGASGRDGWRGLERISSVSSISSISSIYDLLSQCLICFLLMTVGMGFSVVAAERALRKNNNNIESASEWLLNSANQPEIDNAERTAAALADETGKADGKADGSYHRIKILHLTCLL